MNRATLAAAFAALCVCASAETTDETLLVPSYPAATPWKIVTDKSNALILMREWIPADQTRTGTKDILTEQHFFKGKPITPGDFVKGMFRQVKRTCASLRVTGPVEQVENGFSVAYAQMYCSGQKGSRKVGDIFLKAIAGTKAFYVVQYKIRRPAGKNHLAGTVQFSGSQLEQMKTMVARQKAANDYLSDQVKLCAAIDAKGSCLAAPATAVAKPDSAAGAGTGSPVRQADDVSVEYGFTAGKTTIAAVKQKFGEPTFESRNPDGRSVIMYNGLEGKKQQLGCLFDQSGMLVAAIRLNDTP